MFSGRLLTGLLALLSLRVSELEFLPLAPVRTLAFFSISGLSLLYLVTGDVSKQESRRRPGLALKLAGGESLPILAACLLIGDVDLAGFITTMGESSKLGSYTRFRLVD